MFKVFTASQSQSSVEEEEEDEVEEGDEEFSDQLVSFLWDISQEI
jgi:hypothetical protein